MATTTKLRPQPWNGDKINGQPLLRGVLIAPTKLQLRMGESYSIVIDCPFCKRRHVHGWPDGPTKTAPSHKATHCHEGDMGGYYVVPESAEVVR